MGHFEWEFQDPKMGYHMFGIFCPCFVGISPEIEALYMVGTSNLDSRMDIELWKPPFWMSKSTIEVGHFRSGLSTRQTGGTHLNHPYVQRIFP